jgi:hypothetical protein
MTAGFSSLIQPMDGLVAPAAVGFDEQAGFHLDIKGIHKFVAIGLN